MAVTVEALWADAWPNVPFSEATPQEIELFTDHAASLNFYIETTGRRVEDVFYSG